MRAVGLRRRVVIGAAIAGALVGGVFGVLVWSIAEYRNSTESIRVSERSIVRANELELLVLGLESGHRGFLLTKDERFLEQWESARRGLPAAAADFEQLEGEEEDEGDAGEIGEAATDYLQDYSLQVVNTARTDPVAARRLVASGEGRRRVVALRGMFDEFVAGEQQEADERRERADRFGRIAIGLGGAGLFGTVLLVVLFAGYLSRAVVAPVQRVAAATGRIAAGELSARVLDSGRGDEVGRLGRSFNAMAGSLEESRDELESQNAELAAQQGELERAVGELAEERDRVVALHRYAARLTGEAEVEAVAVVVLDDLAQAGRADVGAIYASGAEGGSGYRLVSSLGFHPDQLGSTLQPGDGLAGRALAERTPVGTSYGETGLRMPAWGDEIALRHELHLPLGYGDRVLGVVTLGRIGDPGFSQAELSLLESMAGQAAVALSNGLALRRARREASITRAVLDATPDGICLTDVEGTILLANAPMLDLAVNVLELPQEGTVHERLLAGADLMKDPEAFRAGMAAIAADPELDSRQEYQISASGRSFQGFVGPVRDSAGVLVGRVFILRETTAERQAERLKDELVATVSHELRTPLTSIIGYLELALDAEDSDGDALGAERRGFLEVVDRNARRLLDVVGDLLFVAQVEAGRLELELKPLDLSALAAEAAETARPLAAEKDVALAVEGDRGLVANGDRKRLAQLLANLVSNAVKFTPEGGRVAIRVRAWAQRAVVEVADTGIGIPESEQGRLFERFFRATTATQGAIQGTGLGLVICKAIAEAHGGSISFTSEPGAGTTFRVDLPLVTAATAVSA